MTPRKLKAKREKAGLSQYALSKKTGVSRFKISQFECGYGKLNAVESQVIEKVLYATN